MGPGQKYLTRVRSIFWRSGQVWMGWVFGLGLEISPKNPKFFHFSLRIKKYPVQGWVSLLFTEGQKYAWVRLGQGPSLVSVANN